MMLQTFYGGLTCRDCRRRDARIMRQLIIACLSLATACFSSPASARVERIREPNGAPSHRLPGRLGMAEARQRTQGLGRVAAAYAAPRCPPRRLHEPGRRF